MAGPIQSSLSGALGAVANAVTIGKTVEEIKEQGKTAKEQSKTAKESLKEQRQAELSRLNSQLEETEADITELKGKSLSSITSEQNTNLIDSISNLPKNESGSLKSDNILRYFAGDRFEKDILNPALKNALETGDQDELNRFVAYKELGHRFNSRTKTKELLESQIKDLQGRIKEAKNNGKDKD